MSTVQVSREPVSMRENERVVVIQLKEALATREAYLIGPDGRKIRLPKSVYQLLVSAVDILKTGRSVALYPVEPQLSTQQAADLLNVSRQYLVGLLDEKRIPYDMVGTHRRIRMTDLLEFKAERDRKRQQLLSQMTRENADLYAP